MMPERVQMTNNFNILGANKTNLVQPCKKLLNFVFFSEEPLYEF